MSVKDRPKKMGKLCKVQGQGEKMTTMQQPKQQQQQETEKVKKKKQRQTQKNLLSLIYLASGRRMRNVTRPLCIYVWYGIFPLYFVGALNIRRLRGNAFTKKIQKKAERDRDRGKSARENRLGKASRFHLQ